MHVGLDQGNIPIATEQQLGAAYANFYPFLYTIISTICYHCTNITLERLLTLVTEAAGPIFDRAGG